MRERRSSITQLPARRRSLLAQAALWSSIALLLLGAAWLYPREVLRPLPDPARVPRFSPIAVHHAHVWNPATHHLTGAAVIDVDGDGRYEVFAGGGRGQPDALLRLRSNELRNVIEGTGLSNADEATFGAASIDIDDDGDVDLFVARENGVTLYLNDGAGHFVPRAIDLSLAEHAVPFGVSVGDIDGDGDGDVYVSVFIDAEHLESATFNVPDHAKPNVLLRNDGNLTFVDITDEVTRGQQNTFVSSMVDLDGDRDLDLVLAQNTGQVEILQNQGNGTFQRVAVDTGYGFWMGMAVGDVDNDGDPDLFFTNVGNSIPGVLTSGDLAVDQRANNELSLLRNDGDLRFVDIHEEAGLTVQGFGWGAVFEDVNLDGRLDILYAQNYVHWPVHALKKLPGKVLINFPNPDGPWPYFYSADVMPNYHYGVSPIVVDLDGNGSHDVIWLNSDGPMQAFLNETEATFLHISLPDRVIAQGATVRIEWAEENIYRQQVVSSQGLMTDQAPSVVFGLSDEPEVGRVIVTWADGHETVIENPPLNQRVSVVP